MRNLIGWFTQWLDDDAIIVLAIQISPLLLWAISEILVVKALDGMSENPGISWLKSVLPVFRLCRAMPYGFSPSQKFSPSVVSMEYK